MSIPVKTLPSIDAHQIFSRRLMFFDAVERLWHFGRLRVYPADGKVFHWEDEHRVGHYENAVTHWQDSPGEPE